MPIIRRRRSLSSSKFSPPDGSPKRQTASRLQVCDRANDRRASGSRPRPSSPSSSATGSSAGDETGLAHRIPDSPVRIYCAAVFMPFAAFSLGGAPAERFWHRGAGMRDGQLQALPAVTARQPAAARARLVPQHLDVRTGPQAESPRAGPRANPAFQREHSTLRAGARPRPSRGLRPVRAGQVATPDTAPPSSPLAARSSTASIAANSSASRSGSIRLARLFGLGPAPSPCWLFLPGPAYPALERAQLYVAASITPGPAPARRYQSPP